MVTARDSQKCQLLSAWNSPNLNHMSFLQVEQNYSFPNFTPSALTANPAFLGQHNSDLHGLNREQSNAVTGLFKLLPPYQNISYPTGNPCLKNFQCALPHSFGVSDKPIDYAPRKRFLIFDRSKNHTRLFASHSFFPQDHIIASQIPGNSNGVWEKVASRVNQQLWVKPVVEEKPDEDNLNDREREMIEDTEEINALLYSDSDDEYNDGNDTDGENDEVTSTRHTLCRIEDGCNKDNLLEELTEEGASSNGSPKRRKLLDGTHKKSSLLCIESLMKRGNLCNHEHDMESRYDGARSSCDGINSSKIEKKDKIHEALKILGSVIPGLKGADPLFIIEKAILYLETMKIEAEALGLGYQEHKHATSS